MSTANSCILYLPPERSRSVGLNWNLNLIAFQDAVHRQEPINNKSLQAGSVLPSGAYLQRLHLSDGSSSQGEFNISDLNDCDKINN